MKTSKLDKPEIKKRVIQQLARGESRRSIGRSVGLHHNQVICFASRDDIKALIEREQARLLEAVPDAIENVKTMVAEMKHIPKKETKRLEMAYRASLDVLKGAGIMPSALPAPIIQNIFNQQNNTIISPVIQGLLDQFTGALKAYGDDTGNVIEGEAEGG